jgi:Rieske Fe-S protein
MAEILDNPDPRPGRRRLLAGMTAGGAVAALGGCAIYGSPTGQAAAPSYPAGGDAGSAPAGPGGAVLARLADIPVGGGTVLADQGVVLTQPSAGTVKGFSSVCTHQGCTVASVSGGTINCPCHGSRYAITDGSVTAGPAPRPLPPVPVTVDGDTVTRA